MYASALRSRKTLMQYCSNSAEAIQYADIKLTELEWMQLAETYSILSIAHNLALVSQQESTDSNCFSYFQVASARYAICKQTHIKMFDMSNLWDPETELDKIPTTKMATKDMNTKTRELIGRFKK
jgi:hypothetical protein